MQFFDSLEHVESFLAELAKGDSPLVRVLQARPGQKENRYVQLLSGEPDLSESVASEIAFSTTVSQVPSNSSRLDTIEKDVAEIKAELQQLREELLSFRKQFE